MVNVIFNIQMIDSDEGWLDSYERDVLIEQTKNQLIGHIQNALKDLTCDTHQKPPQVTINGVYDVETEELNVEYDVQTCCQLFLMQCVARLNRN
jgi:hypothetical protein